MLNASMCRTSVLSALRDRFQASQEAKNLHRRPVTPKLGSPAAKTAETAAETALWVTTGDLSQCQTITPQPKALGVTGDLHDHQTCWDVLRAALPVGTVSGAPKVKAMELIDQLEVARRGPYSGGFGGVSFTGDMDIALALRTIVFPSSSRYDTMYSYKDAKRRREWVAHLQAGAGIVADSNPDDEQRECENKAAALARAIDLAESAFVDK